jgi:hypothetical protein
VGFCLVLNPSNNKKLSSNCSGYPFKIRRDFPSQQTSVNAAFLKGDKKRDWLVEPYCFTFGLILMIAPMRNTAVVVIVEVGCFLTEGLPTMQAIVPLAKPENTTSLAMHRSIHVNCGFSSWRWRFGAG